MNHDLSIRLRSWLLGQLSDAEARVVEMEFLRSPNGNALHEQVETELMTAYFGGTLTENEEAGWSRLLRRCSRLAATVGASIRARLLAGDKLTGTSADLELRLSAELVTLSRQYRDGSLSEVDEVAFEGLISRQPSLAALVEAAVQIQELPGDTGDGVSKDRGSKLETADLTAELASSSTAGGSPFPRPAFSSNGGPIDLDATSSDGETAAWVRRRLEQS